MDECRDGFSFFLQGCENHSGEKKLKQEIRKKWLKIIFFKFLFLKMSLKIVHESGEIFIIKVINLFYRCPTPCLREKVKIIKNPYSIFLFNLTFRFSPKIPLKALNTVIFSTSPSRVTS